MVTVKNEKGERKAAALNIRQLVCSIVDADPDHNNAPRARVALIVHDASITCVAQWWQVP